MEFDITNIDKINLIQALYIYSNPIHLGKIEFKIRNLLDENVEGLSQEECEIILHNFNNLKTGCLKILDYHNGKPMKLVFNKKINGRILVESSNYDARNGKYRFFEALLNTFLIDEIHITKKGYNNYVLKDLPKNLIRTFSDELMFKKILKFTIKTKNEFGNIWLIDKSKISFIPYLLQSFY